MEIVNNKLDCVDKAAIDCGVREVYYTYNLSNINGLIPFGDFKLFEFESVTSMTNCISFTHPLHQYYLELFKNLYKISFKSLNDCLFEKYIGAINENAKFVGLEFGFESNCCYRFILPETYVSFMKYIDSVIPANVLSVLVQSRVVYGVFINTMSIRDFMLLVYLEFYDVEGMNNRTFCKIFTAFSTIINIIKYFSIENFLPNYCKVLDKGYGNLRFDVIDIDFDLSNSLHVIGNTQYNLVELFKQCLLLNKNIINGWGYLKKLNVFSYKRNSYLESPTARKYFIKDNRLVWDYLNDV